MIFLTLFIAIVISSSIECYHLKFMDCSKPNAEGTILVYKNASWLECKDGKLSIEHCIAEINGPKLDCVPHGVVKKGIDEKMQNWFYKRFAVAFYIDSDHKYAHCYKIQMEQQDKLLTSQFKKDCTKGMAKENNGKAKTDLCALKGRKAYYAEEDEWYSCKDGSFQLQSCMMKKSDSEFYCISKKKIEHALGVSKKRDEFNKNKGSFCGKFFKKPQEIMKNYQSELTACNNQEEIEIPTTSTTTTTTTTSSSSTTTTTTTTTTAAPPPTVAPTERPEPSPLPEYDTTKAVEYQQTSTSGESKVTSGTESPIPKPAVITDVRPYLGSTLMQPELEKCKEEGKRSYGIWYQCNIPTKCVVRYSPPNTACLSFASIEKMYQEYQNATDLGPKAGWDDDRFNKIYGHLEGGRHQNLYEKLKAAESGNYEFFHLIACRFGRDAPNDKNVTIPIKEFSTKVSPRRACEIAFYKTPFKIAFLEKFYENC